MRQRVRLRLGLVAAALCVGAACALLPPRAGAADDPAALRADRAFVAAIVKADTGAVDKLVDPEFTWTDAAGKTFGRVQVLASLPKPIIADESAAKIASRSYGQVEIVQAHSGKANTLRLWVKRPEGWRLLVYQEVKLMDTAPTVTPGTGTTCDNPCKSLPYEAKSATEQEVLKVVYGAANRDGLSRFAHLGEIRRGRIRRSQFQQRQSAGQAGPHGGLGTQQNGGLCAGAGGGDATVRFSGRHHSGLASPAHSRQAAAYHTPVD